jgi:hypothetical protein
LRTLVLGLVLAACAPASAQSTDATMRLGLLANVQAGLRPPDAGAALALSLGWRPWPFFEPELVVGAGVLAPGALGAPPPRFSNRFSIGARSILPFDAVRPFLWTAFHHGHVVDVDDAVRAPGAVLAASDTAGVHHLSGGEAGLGVVVPIEIDIGQGRSLFVEACARASLLYFPALLGAHDEVTTLLDVGLAFPLGWPAPPS